MAWRFCHQVMVTSAVALLLASGAGVAETRAPAHDRSGAGVDAAATTSDAAPPEGPRARRGPVTNLPLPRFVSLKASEGNVRRGPSLSHRIDWVFTQRDVPLEVTAEFGHWRQVRDRDGAGGWVHYALLSGVRTALVEEDMVALRQKPSGDGRVVARAEAGAIVRLGRCLPDWCRVSAQGQSGWVLKPALWGVRPDEVRD